MLKFEKGNAAFYEAKLKYCNFYLAHSGENCEKTKIKDIFDSLIKAEYYKACCDYGKFLLREEKYDEALSIFKKGLDNSMHFCLSEYIYLFIQETNFNHLLSDYKLISYILKNICLLIAIDKFCQGSFFYANYYLTKHSSFNQKIEKEFSKYSFELFQTTEKSLQFENNELEKNLVEKYKVQIYGLLGQMYYYGISNLLKSDKEKALIYFKKAYRVSKEKKDSFIIRINYIYILKCRKYLFKNNKITLRKLNKTKEKLFRIFEETYIEILLVFEIYNYYKLYKLVVYGNTKNKLISLLKLGKNKRMLHHFKDIVYVEKCKLALEKEYSNKFSINNNIILKNEDNDNKNNINLDFRLMDSNKKYDIKVSKDLQFIAVIHKLFNKFPELESKKIGTYESNGKNVGIFDTIEENDLASGSIILINNKFD